MIGLLKTTWQLAGRAYSFITGPDAADAEADAQPVSTVTQLQALPEPVAPQKPDERIQLKEQSYKTAFEKARKSGLPEPDETMLKAVEAGAQAMAQSRFRPASEQQEERRLGRLHVVEDAIKQRTLERDAAAVRQRDRSNELAGLGGRPPYPVISPVLVQAATVALTIAFAPSFHDLLVGLPGLFKWVFGGLCGLGVSRLLVHGILPGPEPKD